MDRERRYKKQIPSPVALDYPYRNLTGIVGAIPSSLTEDETKNRLSKYLQELKSEPPFRADYDDIDTYLKEFKSEPEFTSNGKDLDETLQEIKDFKKRRDRGFSDYLKESHDFNEDLNKNIASAYMADRGGINHYADEWTDPNPWIKNDLGLDNITKSMMEGERYSNEASPYLPSQGRSEIYDDFKIQPSPLIKRMDITLRSPLLSENFEDALNDADLYNEMFKASNQLKGKKDEILMLPFEKAGMKPNPSAWEKIKGLFKK